VAKLVLIFGGVLAFAALLVTAIAGISDSDRYGRVRMPGERALPLDAGGYGIYYEEQVETGENDVFEPQDGIRLRVRGLGGAPDPKVDLGGLGSQVGTDNFTAETIGSLEVKETGRYGLVVGGPPQPAVEPAITIGKKGSEAFVLGAKRAGYIVLATGALAGLFLLGRRLRGRGEASAWPGAPMPAPLSRAPAVTGSVAAPVAPAPSPAPAAAQKPSDLEQLERLSGLRRSGVITDEEFERVKRKLLS